MIFHKQRIHRYGQNNCLSRPAFWHVKSNAESKSNSPGLNECPTCIIKPFTPFKRYFPSLTLKYNPYWILSRKASLPI